MSRRIRGLCVVLIIGAGMPTLAHAQVTAWLEQVAKTMSSLGVVTKQVSISAKNSDSMKLQAQQAFESTLADAATAHQVWQTVEDFGPNGQLIDGCYQVGMASQVALTESATAAHASNALARLYTIGDNGAASSGGIAGALGMTAQATTFPYAASVAQRIARHMSRYCTVAEAQAGYCTLNANGMQGGDVDFSLHLQPGKTYGWDQVEASTDFIKTVAPMRATASSGSCISTACIAAQQARIRQEAMMSMARYSFIQFTEAHTTQKVGDAQSQ